MYICGPTVYDYAHIGHARTYINSDLLVRALKYFGYEVMVVMNITDVGHLTSDADTGEDKMEKKAKKEKKAALAIAEFYTKDFFAMAGKLNIMRPNVVSKATEHIEEMIELVRKLEEKGFTYRTSDGIYFDTSKLKDYGKLARLDKEGLQEGISVEKNLEKKNPTDFAVWKFAYKNGRAFDSAQDDPAGRRQLEWESPWGAHSFPGWHIECSAMSMKYLGESFDLHTGGVDHIPVHHTNEIAQSEAATGKKFVRFWFHSAHLMVEGEKMSKSLKNFLRVLDVEKKGFEPLALRYLFLTSHYRMMMNFTWEAMEAAHMAYTRLKEAAVMLRHSPEKAGQERHESEVERWKTKFMHALSDDLGVPEAVAVMWELIKSDLSEQEKYQLLLEFDSVLGLGLKEVRVEALEARIPLAIQKLVDKRETKRLRKDFAAADDLRKEIEEKGYTVEDTEEGPVVRKGS